MALGFFLLSRVHLAAGAVRLPRRSGGARLDLHRRAAEQHRGGALVRRAARPGARHRDRGNLGGRHRARAAGAVPDRALGLADDLRRARRPGAGARPAAGARLHAARSGRPRPAARRRAPRGARARTGERGAVTRELEHSRASGGGGTAGNLLAPGGRLRPHHGRAVRRAAVPDSAPARSRHAGDAGVAGAGRDRRHGRRRESSASARSSIAIDQRDVAAVCFCLQAPVCCCCG